MPYKNQQIVIFHLFFPFFYIYFHYICLGKSVSWWETLFSPNQLKIPTFFSLRYTHYLTSNDTDVPLTL